mgnify:CR=1 FL=1
MQQVPERYAPGGRRADVSNQVVVRRVLDAYGPERCIWASDWPYLRAPYRLDYGTLLTLAADWFTEDQCRNLMWDTPSRLLDW